MSWWFSTSFVSLVLGSFAGLALVARRQRTTIRDAERRRLAAEVESDRLRLRIAALETETARVEELEHELATFEGQAEQLEARRVDLALLREETDRLGRSVVAMTVEASRAGPLGIELRRARTEVQQSQALIGRMQGDLAAILTAGRPALADCRLSPAELTTAAERGESWQDGVTALGTPGANHYDDLKEIRGIGPVMERTLNSLGIHTWEQIAALTDSDVEKLSAALETFSDRIERDDWVGGANELLAAGHVPSGGLRATTEASTAGSQL